MRGSGGLGLSSTECQIHLCDVFSAAANPSEARLLESANSPHTHFGTRRSRRQWATGGVGSNLTDVAIDPLRKRVNSCLLPIVLRLDGYPQTQRGDALRKNPCRQPVGTLVSGLAVVALIALTW